MAPRGRPVIDFTSTYTADYSSGGRGRSGRPTRSLSAAPTYRPSAGSVPTSGRPSTRSGGVSQHTSYLICLGYQRNPYQHLTIKYQIFCHLFHEIESQTCLFIRIKSFK